MRNLPSENDIVSNWRGDMDKPVVSICCITYNHEKYIEDALEGFLIQKTDFPFEILIHDDASTDSTPEIIRDYKTKYPKLINPIYQNENQYSKNIRPMWDVIYPCSKGEYLAICEGDDRWNSDIKLMLQVAEMQSDDGIGLCGHNAKYIDSEGNHAGYFNNKRCSKKSLSFDILVKRWSIPTASILFRKSVLNEIPGWMAYIYNGDWVIQLLIAHKSKVVLLPDVLSDYRIHDAGVSKIILNKSLSSMLIYQIRALTLVDEYTNWEHSEVISCVIREKSITNKYRLTKKKYFGLYRLSNPLLLMREMVRIIKKILLG